MNGEQLQAARKELKWSRDQLSAAAGMTHSQLAGIEQGRREAKPEEAEALQAVLLTQLGRVLEETGEHPVVVVPEEDSRVASWNGLQRGDEVQVRGEGGRFTFLYHHADDHQEYVQLFGPIPGTVPRSRSPRAPHERSVLPDRVVIRQKKR